MARYRGPRLKKVRSLGTVLPGLTRKSAERRPHPPGQHGKGRKSNSPYKERLQEKQKIRFNYGVSERVLRKYFYEAKAQRKVTGHELLSILESRADNVLFRSGLAPTIPAARQLISHAHIKLNGKRMNVASCLLREGDVITLKEKSQNLKVIQAAVENPPAYAKADFLDVNSENKTIKFTRRPGREDVILDINEQLVVEYYAAR